MSVVLERERLFCFQQFFFTPPRNFFVVKFFFSQFQCIQQFCPTQTKEGPLCSCCCCCCCCEGRLLWWSRNYAVCPIEKNLKRSTYENKFAKTNGYTGKKTISTLKLLPSFYFIFQKKIKHNLIVFFAFQEIFYFNVHFCKSPFSDLHKLVLLLCAQ